MRQPFPPLIELELYFSDCSERQALLRVATYLEHHGAHIASADIADFTGCASFDFSSPTDVETQHRVLHGWDDFRTLVDQNPSLLPVTLTVANSPGAAPESLALVTFLSIPPEVVGKDHHPVELILEGEWLDVADKQLKRRNIAQIQIVFRELVAMCQPDYAAFTSEYGMECPADLLRDPRSYAFRHFHIASKYISTDNVVRVLSEFPDVLKEIDSFGIYVSHERLFELGTAKQRMDGYAVSEAIGRLIATQAAK